MKTWFKTCEVKGQSTVAFFSPDELRVKIEDHIVIIRLPRSFNLTEIDSKLTENGYLRLT